MLSFNVRFSLNPNWKLFLFKNNSVNPKIEFVLRNLNEKILHKSEILQFFNQKFSFSFKSFEFYHGEITK